MKKFSIRCRPGAVACVLAGAFTVLAVAKWKLPDQVSWLRSGDFGHMGAEYNKIATAILDGRGFSDPFHSQSGATAWMPPVQPYLLAATRWCVDDDPEVMRWAWVMLIFTTTWLTAWIVFRQAALLRRVPMAVVIVSVGYANEFFDLFQRSHDHAWLLIVVAAVWAGGVRLFTVPITPNGAAGWGVVGAVTALSSPVIGMAWAIITLARGWRDSHGRIGVACVVCVALVSPWMIRNRVVLGRWVPIKSNGMYELWQSQLLDEDGVLDNRSFRHHPWGSLTVSQEYHRRGEIAFIQSRSDDVVRAIAAAPSTYFRRVGNRLAAATFMYTPSRTDRLKDGRGWKLTLRRCLFPIPFAACLLIVMARPLPLEPELTIAIAITFLVLVPYVLISYYERYALPLLGMKMLITLYGWDTLVRCRSVWTRPGRPE